MSKLPPSVIKEIAREITIGNTCYLHRYSAKVTTIDNSIEEPNTIATQEQTVKELERKSKDYVKIEKPSWEDKLVIMHNFLEKIHDKSVHKQLSNALNRKNPARNFMQAVEGDMELNQHWENFKIEAFRLWVSDVIIDAYNY